MDISHHCSYPYDKLTVSGSVATFAIISIGGVQYFLGPASQRLMINMVYFAPYFSLPGAKGSSIKAALSNFSFILLDPLPELFWFIWDSLSGISFFESDTIPGGQNLQKQCTLESLALFVPACFCLRLADFADLRTTYVNTDH